MNLTRVKIKQNGLIVGIAAKFMKLQPSENLATTIGHIIRLKNISALDFVKNDQFLRHELQHIIQFNSEKGFRLKYLAETIKHGYENNRYEIDARNHANDSFPDGVVVYTDGLLVTNQATWYNFFNFITHPPLGYLNSELGLRFCEYPDVIIKP